MINTETTRTNLCFWYIILLLALGLFSAFSLSRIQQPVTQDELNWLIASKTYYADGAPLHLISNNVVIYSPYLYLHSVVTAFRLFGESDIVARLPGIFCGLIAIIMVFVITKSLSQGNQAKRVKWAAISSLLYAITPAVIQGAAIIDIDNTILVPAILFLCWTFLRYLQEENYTWAMLMGLALSIAMWARITTPPVIVLILSFYILISKNAIKTKLIFFCAVFSGVFLFVASWYLYCYSTDILFWGPFEYTLGSFQGKTGHFTLSYISQNMIYLILWLGMFSSLLFIIIVIERCKRYIKRPSINQEDIFLWIGAALILGYTFVGGTLFGYPKYHSPAIPLLYIYVCIVLSRYKEFENIHSKAVLSIVVIALAFVIRFLVIGDLLYVFRHSLRNAIAFALPLSPILINIAVKISLFILIFATIFAIFSWTSFRKAWLLLLVLFVIGTNTGTAVVQNSASYHTGYNYGGEGTIEAAQFIRKNVPTQSFVFAPSEIIYYLKLPKSKHLPNPIWTDMNELRKRLADKNTSALVYSIATNTALQIQLISSTKEIQELLHHDFDQTKIKNYTIWIRKSN